MLSPKKGKIITNGEASLKLLGQLIDAYRKVKTTKFKILKRKSHYSTWQVDFSSFSSVGNPPFLLSRLPNK
jgi:hypothetical protein